MAGTGMSGSRKPTVMKILEGTARKDRMVNEPKPEVVLIPPPMPEGLNEYGQKEWEKMTLELTKIGMLTTIDSSQLAAYCNEFGNYWECEIDRKNPEIPTIDKAGLFDKAQKHLKQARDLAVQFGFTPASRSRINLPKEEQQSRLDKL